MRPPRCARRSLFSLAIKAAVTQFISVDTKLSPEEKSSVLKQILNNAIVADGMADIFAPVGLDKPNIGLLSDEFLEDVRRTETRNLAVELLESGCATRSRRVRESVRAKSRILVRRCLKKWKYPPDWQADAVELVLRQAECWSDEWSK